MSNPITDADYRRVAKKLGCTFRVGKYGVKLLPSSLPGKLSYKLFAVTSLDGWLFGDEMVEELRRRDFEL